MKFSFWGKFQKKWAPIKPIFWITFSTFRHIYIDLQHTLDKVLFEVYVLWSSKTLSTRPILGNIVSFFAASFFFSYPPASVLLFEEEEHFYSTSTLLKFLLGGSSSFSDPRLFNKLQKHMVSRMLRYVKIVSFEDVPVFFLYLLKHFYMKKGLERSIFGEIWTVLIFPGSIFACIKKCNTPLIFFESFLAYS